MPGLGVAPLPDVTGLDQAPAAVLGYVAHHAWARAGDTLGTACAAPAFAIAERLARESPRSLDEAKLALATWPTAIVWLLAEDGQLVAAVLRLDGHRVRRLFLLRRQHSRLTTDPNYSRDADDKAAASRESG